MLGVSTSGYYDWLKRKPSKRAIEDRQYLRQIKSIHKEVRETYGSPRMHAELIAQGHSIGRGRVERLMSSNAIQAKQARRNKRVYKLRSAQISVGNILDRQFYASAPNKKWVSDITFIETREGWLYLAIVLDLYSRAIVGWSMGKSINGQLVRDALAMAVEHRSIDSQVLVHSDQGSQYTAHAYHETLQNYGMVCSMSRKGECHDNAVAESFFHSLKSELVYDEKYLTRAEAKQSVFKYIEIFYNRKRRHSYLNYQAPLVYETMNGA
jgi:transposase InsO family protein